MSSSQPQPPTTTTTTTAAASTLLPVLPRLASVSGHYRPPNGATTATASTSAQLDTHSATVSSSAATAAVIEANSHLPTTRASSLSTHHRTLSQQSKQSARMSSQPHSGRSKAERRAISAALRYHHLIHATADAWDADAAEDLDADDDDDSADDASHSERQFRQNGPRTPSTVSAPTSPIKDTRMSAIQEAAAKAVRKHELPRQVQVFSKDHASSLSNYDPRPPVTDTRTARELLDINAKLARFEKFRRVLSESHVDLRELRKLSWNGIPDELRPMAWQLMMSYLPCNSDRRESTLARKRKEYEECVAQAFARGEQGLDQTIWHQIHIDVPRTHPHIPLYQQETTQQALERILYCWAIRHPASGYVQGINDLLTPFFQVFLSSYTGGEDPEQFELDQLSPELLKVVEADSFWCMTKLLDGIQDNYTHGQPGIQRQINCLRDLIMRVDPALAKHLERESVEYIQFAFRWMNCLLMRELALRSVIRMWDTYLSEDLDGFSDFHAYVCAAFLVKWSSKLQTMDFQDVITFLQSVPTATWTNRDVEMLLSQAFMWKTCFHDARGHLMHRA